MKDDFIGNLQFAGVLSMKSDSNPPGENFCLPLFDPIKSCSLTIDKVTCYKHFKISLAAAVGLDFYQKSGCKLSRFLGVN